MSPFDLAQTFLEDSARAESVPALAAIFQRTLERLGFPYYACCSHVDPKRVPRNAVVLFNYPENWARTFIEGQFYKIDPVLIRAEQSLMPFFWDTPSITAGASKPQKAILAEAASNGVKRGYTIPIHLPNTVGAFPASCSVVPDSGSIDIGSYFTVQLLAVHLYDAASRKLTPRPSRRPRTALIPRERQCLELAAQGKVDWEIGHHLHLSAHTVHQYIENAKRRLGVRTRIQAVVRALQTGQISFGDVMRAESDPTEPREGEELSP